MPLPVQIRDRQRCDYYAGASIDLGPADDPHAFPCMCGRVIRLRRNPRSRQGAWMAPSHYEPMEVDKHAND